MKKICYVFVFNGFADHEIALAATNISKSNGCQLKTIAITKDPVKAASGLTIVPDLDFIPDVDLIDIDADNTAMLVLPGIKDEIMPLVNHCLLYDIPVVQSSEFIHHIPEPLIPVL